MVHDLLMEFFLLIWGWGGSLCFRSAKKGKEKDASSTAATVGGRDSAASSSTSSVPRRGGD